MLSRSLCVAWVLCCWTAAARADGVLQLKPIISGLSQPLFLTTAGDGSGRLFIVTKSGKIWIRKPGSSDLIEFLDLTSQVTNSSEMGLLGLAFHPFYATNGRFFVDYATEVGGPRRTVIAEYHVSAEDPDHADPSSESILLSFDQPAANHDGGMLAFGPDGYLYVAAGDGGGAGDTYGNGQNLATVLGAILRLDIDSGDPYAIPPGNPFVDTPDARPEIWAYGLRNPWRFSFDRLTGQLYAGDVGQNQWEEIDLIERGRNYGWNVMEGNHCYPAGQSCDPTAFEAPITEYSHAEGSSVTGGYVYRGSRQTSLWGNYIFGDYGSGRIWSLSATPGGGWKRELLLDTDASIASFGEDPDGELYLVDLGGTVYRLNFGERSILPQIGDGFAPSGRLKSRLILVNPDDSEVRGTLRFHEQSGTDRALTVDGEMGTSFSVQIAPHSSLVMETSGTSDPAWIGWAAVEGDGPFRSLALYAFQPSNEEQSFEAGVASASPGRSFLTYAERDVASGIDTGFALANLSGRTVQIALSLTTDSLGQMQAGLTLGPGEQTAAFLSELFSGIPEGVKATVRISADQDIAVAALRTDRGRPLSSLPVTGE